MSNIHPLEALGDPTRRRLFERLREGPCSVNELVEVVPVSQPAVSQHLKVLKNAQLVRVEKQGQQRIYHLNPTGLAELRRYVEGLWEDVLGAFQEEAARMPGALDQDNPEQSEHSHRKEATKTQIYQDAEKETEQEDKDEGSGAR